MPRVRKPTVAEPEIVVMPGNPLVIGHAPRARTISAAFLNSYNDHFNVEGHGIFAKIYKDYPVDYFWGLITLAKVMKIEIGGPHEFDRTRVSNTCPGTRLGSSANTGCRERRNIISQTYRQRLTCAAWLRRSRHDGSASRLINS